MSKCGGEGLDFKGVENVIITDPPWNDSNLKQIIGRAVRYKSHEHLPKNKRKVNVYEIISVSPGHEKNWFDKDKISGDVLLYKIIRKKEKDNIQVRSSLKALGSN